MVNDGNKLDIIRILHHIGENPDRNGLKETPSRVVKSWDEIYKGYKQDPAKIFTVFDSEGYDGIVYLKDIELYSTCEHHMLPFYGKAHIGYIPNEKTIIGISKLARVVDLYAKRLQVQERLNKQIVDHLEKYLEPKGCICIIEATHMCMRMRGVNKQNSVMGTLSVTGVFTEPEMEQKFINLIK